MLRNIKDKEIAEHRPIVALGAEIYTKMIFAKLNIIKVITNSISVVVLNEVLSRRLSSRARAMSMIPPQDTMMLSRSEYLVLFSTLYLVNRLEIKQYEKTLADIRNMYSINAL